MIGSLSRLLVKMKRQTYVKWLLVLKETNKNEDAIVHHEPLSQSVNYIGITEGEF